MTRMTQILLCSRAIGDSLLSGGGVRALRAAELGDGYLLCMFWAWQASTIVIVSPSIV